MNTSHSNVLLRAGFLAVIVLLLFAGWEFARFQSAGAQVQLEAYHRYIEKDRAIVTLRRAIWLGGNRVRDYFLNTSANRRQIFLDQIRETEQILAGPLRQLKTWNRALVEREGLEQRLEVYLAEMRDLSNSPPDAQPSQLVEQRWSPKRIAAHDALEEISKFAQEELRQAELRLRKDTESALTRLRALLFMAVGIAALVAITSIRLSARWEKERQNHLANLSEANIRLKQLSDRLLDIQEEERRSLSQELHDEVGQTLTALRMELSQSMRTISEASAKERLERARALTEKTVQMVRNISLMLRPSLLDDLGLGPALQWQVEEFARRANITATFEGVEVGESLEENLKTSIFRIAQEALNNIEKYAQAHHVQVSLRQDGETLILSIQDDGIGLERSRNAAKSPNSGSGILGMRQRIQRWQGQLEITSSPAGGTLVVARLPVVEAETKTKFLEVESR